MEKEILDDEYTIRNHLFQDDLTRIERLKSMFLDHFIMSMIIGFIFIIPVMILENVRPNFNTDFIFFLLILPSAGVINDAISKIF